MEATSGAPDGSGSTFRDLNLPLRVRTGRHDLVGEFYVPCLRLASSYDRAAGYFTSAGLSLAAQGLAHLIHHGGHIRLVASPVLHEHDIEAIRKGVADRDTLIRENAHTELRDVEDHLRRDRLAALAWLIARGQLTIKLAVRTRGEEKAGRGLYHEKIGVIHHANGDFVAFDGSSNETAGGLVENFESLTLHKSWATDARYADAIRDDFESLWTGEESGVEVIDFTDAAEEILEPYKTPSPPSRDPGEGYSSPPPPLPPPPPENKWRHQDEAIEIFLEKKRGILEMATGTGKTRTALQIVRRLIDADQVDTIIIATRGTDLLDQWHQNVFESLQDLLSEWLTYRTYSGHRDGIAFRHSPESAILLTSDMNLAKSLSGLRTEQLQRTLLIVDEVHGFGSQATRTAIAGLTDAIPFRLGLSTTPNRAYDSEGNESTEAAIGPVLFEFGLADAIKRGILCPFDYQPIHFHPTDDDRDRIQNVHKQKAAREADGKPMTKEEVWTQIARVYKTSKAKIPLLQAAIDRSPELLDRCIIFVAEKDYGDFVLSIVQDHRHRFHTYYDGDSKDVLIKFGRGELECLVTCHRLSEGIDIRDLKTVILVASDRSPLETIQRIGRCLRTDPRDHRKRATVVDFIRQPKSENDPMTPDQEREQWLSEISKTKPENADHE